MYVFICLIRDKPVEKFLLQVGLLNFLLPYTSHFSGKKKKQTLKPTGTIYNKPEIQNNLRFQFLFFKAD